jgi:hypothetical protein
MNEIVETVRLGYDEIRTIVLSLIYRRDIFSKKRISRKEIFEFTNTIPAGKYRPITLPETVHRALSDIEDEALVTTTGRLQALYAITKAGHEELKNCLEIYNALGQTLHAVQTLTPRSVQTPKHPSHHTRPM